jgi:predicted glutamine amidotransferase
MCRWFCYIGETTNIYDLLYNPSNAIFKQCYLTPYTPTIEKENPRDNAINVDGFGIGLYQTKDTPFIYTSINTPWSDINLKRISRYMDSHLFFAHIRGVKPFNEYSFIHELNCHPFRYKKYMMQHNGFISGYKSIKSNIHSQLNKTAQVVIKGNVDSEDIFDLFINQFQEHELDNYVSANKIYQYLIQAIRIIINLNNNKPSSFNISISDGINIVCIRYINSEDEEPPSLYYKKYDKYILVASEPIYLEDKDWVLIKKNTAIILNKNEYFFRNIVI